MTPYAPHRAAALAAVLFVAAALPALAAGQDAPPQAPLYTAAQAEAGKVVFDTICAKCHQATLLGKDDAPPLSGKYFANSWGGHKVSEILEFAKVNMPMDKPGTLTEDTYIKAIAYVLSRNGVPAGDTPLAMGATGIMLPKN